MYYDAMKARPTRPQRGYDLIGLSAPTNITSGKCQKTADTSTVHHLEQRGFAVEVDLVGLAALPPAAIKQNLGRRNPRHRRGGLLHHDTGQRFDGRAGVCSCERLEIVHVHETREQIEFRDQTPLLELTP